MKKAARFTITGTAWFESYRREVYNLPSKAEKPWPALLRDNQRHVVLFFFFLSFVGRPSTTLTVCVKFADFCMTVSKTFFHVT